MRPFVSSPKLEMFWIDGMPTSLSSLAAPAPGTRLRIWLLQ